MTKSKLRKLLTKPKFRKWLEDQKPGAHVGDANLSTLCPIARFIGYEGGEEQRAAVGCLGIDAGAAITIKTPTWCRHFITDVDRLGWAANVTASRALKILDGIK